jgi:fatty-acid desaturase
MNSSLRASRPSASAFADYATWSRFNSAEFSVFALVHLAAFAAPLAFSWPGLAACITMTIAVGQWGVITGYHRMLTHRSFVARKPLRCALAFLGVLSLQKGPIGWAAIHRFHHLVSDQETDPHSPRVSPMWAHWLWPFFRHPAYDAYRASHRLASDLEQDPCLRFLERFHSLVALSFALVIVTAGFACGGPPLALSLLVWGYIIPVVYTWQMMLLGASANHMWGYCNYATQDDSRNTWWIALLSFGDGWHNNHHAHPCSAAHGHRWFEFDPTYRTILLLERLGLAREVMRPPGCVHAGLREGVVI